MGRSAAYAGHSCFILFLYNYFSIASACVLTIFYVRVSSETLSPRELGMPTEGLSMLDGYPGLGLL